MKNLIDPIQLQRLIDGECSLDDLRSLLVAARGEPAMWEEIGLALLEDRAWLHRLQSVHAELPTRSIDVAESPTINATTINHSGNSPYPDPIGSMESTVVDPAVVSIPLSRSISDQLPRRRESNTPWRSWLAMAASLCAVAVLGYSAGQQESLSGFQRNVVQQPSSVKGTDPLLADRSSPQTTLASLEPDYRMELPENDRLLPNGEVPMFIVKSLDQWDKLDRSLPQKLRFSAEELAELNLQGIGVHKEFDVLTGNFEDGRTFIVPIRSIRFTPVQ